MKSLRPLIVSAAEILLLAAVFAAVAHAQTYEDQVTEIVNQERWTNGQLPPLKRNALLDNSAGTHSGDMAARDFFQHCDPDNGTLPWDRMNTAGYTGWNYAAENIAAGYSTPQAVMNGWMNSSGHRANILSANVREIGIGYVMQSGDQGNVRIDQNGDCTSDSFNNGPYTRYWTQNFGRRGTVYPLVIEREAYETVNVTVNLYLYGSGWAQEMRFRNEAGLWSSWEPFASGKTWTLSAGNGTKTVTAEIRNGGTTYQNSDTIELNASNPVGVPEDVAGGRVLALHPGAPNPFFATTRLGWSQPAEGPARLTIYDAAGRLVATLVDGFVDAGDHAVDWDGRDRSGQAVRAGIFFARLEASGGARTVKLIRSR